MVGGLLLLSYLKLRLGHLGFGSYGDAKLALTNLRIIVNFDLQLQDVCGAFRLDRGSDLWIGLVIKQKFHLRFLRKHLIGFVLPTQARTFDNKGIGLLAQTKPHWGKVVYDQQFPEVGWWYNAGQVFVKMSGEIAPGRSGK